MTMTSYMSPFAPTGSTKRCSAILDIDLALSSFGLLFALRLSEAFDVWLVRELWDILDNTTVYRSKPDLLFPSEPEANSGTFAEGAAVRDIPEILEQWETARVESDLGGFKIYWVGDAMRESLFPKGLDTYLVYRFEKLAKCLDSKAENSQRVGPAYGRGEHAEPAFLRCFREAASLAAALTQYRSIIFTRRALHQEQKANGIPVSEPLICSYLRQWGIATRQVSQSSKLPILSGLLAPVFANTGITELIWGGLDLAAVHILAPNAVTLTLPRNKEPYFNESLPMFPAMEEDPNTNLWDGASAFWYPIH
jgi:hypothetical protein